MSPHRSMNHGDAELWNKIPGRLCAVENRVEALAASCRECREERRDHHRLVMKAIEEYRDTFREHFDELETKLNKKLDTLLSTLACTKKPKRKKGVCQ